MVVQHYRWDFYGLSTDSKPDATNPKVADGSTYYEADTSKLYVWYKDQWYEKQSTGGGGGEAGAIKELTAEDYNYPEDNPTDFALWLLPNGIYHIADDTATKRMSKTSYFTAGNTFIVTDLPYDSTDKYLILFGDPAQSGTTGSYGIQLVKVNAITGSQVYRQGVVMHE